MFKKRFLSIILLAVFFIASFNTFALAKNITVNVNNQDLSFVGDQAPILKNGRVLVPMRKIFEALKMEVRWYPEDQGIVVGNQKTIIAMMVGAPLAVVFTNDNLDGENVFLDVAPQLLNDRVLVPIRFIGETSGAIVNWDEKNNKVIIYN